jgi:hypothetical protein
VREVADCAVITHFTSAQLPTGRPAREGEAQTPLTDAAGDAALEGDPLEVLLVELALGAAGLRRVAVFSKPQPAVSAVAKTMADKLVFFMSSLQFCIGTPGFGVHKREFCKKFRKSAGSALSIAG